MNDGSLKDALLEHYRSARYEFNLILSLLLSVFLLQLSVSMIGVETGALFYIANTVTLISPIVIIAAFWRITKIISDQAISKKTYGILDIESGEDIYHDITEKSDANKFLLRLENHHKKQIAEKRHTAKQYHIIGSVLCISATIPPFITWMIAASIYEKTEKLNNIWALTMSSMSFGFVVLSASLIMLRTSKFHLEAHENLVEHIRAIARLRIAFSLEVEEKFREPLIKRALEEIVSPSVRDKKGDQPENEKTELQNKEMAEIAAKTTAVKAI